MRLVLFLLMPTVFSTLVGKVIFVSFIFDEWTTKMSHTESSTQSKSMLGNRMDLFYCILHYCILQRFFQNQKMNPFDILAIFVKAYFPLRIKWDNPDVIILKL